MEGVAKALDRDEALAAFERFKQAVAQIAAVPKAAVERVEPKRRKKAPRRSPD